MFKMCFQGNSETIPRHFFRMATQNQLSGIFFSSTAELDGLIEREGKRDPTISNRPVALVAVFGFDFYFGKPLLTDWLIHFYQNDSNENHLKNIGTHKKLEFMPNTDKLKEGIYLWPVLYKVRSESEPLICLLLYIHGQNERINNLAINICSQAIVFGNPDKVRLEGLMAQCIMENKPGKPVIIETGFQRDGKFRVTNKEFLKALGANILPYKQTLDGKTVRLNGLSLYWTKTVASINEKYTQFRRKELDSTAQTSMDVKSVSKISTSKPLVPAKPTKLAFSKALMNFSGKTSAPRISTTPASPPFTKAGPIFKGDIPLTPPPTMIKSSRSHSNLTETLSKWLSVQSSPWKSSEMLNEMLRDQPPPDRDLIQELEKVCNVVDAFSSDLRNIFDNHVCFYGEKGKTQLSNCMEKARSKIALEYNTKIFHYAGPLMKYFNEACNRLEAIYMDHNSQIIDTEIKLANYVKEESINQFKSRLEGYFKKPGSIYQLELISARLQESLVLITTHCMDLGGRINQVQMEVGGTMLTEMEEIWREMKGSVKRTERVPRKKVDGEGAMVGGDKIKFQGRRNKLLEQCKTIRRQLEGGDVKVRRVFLKDVMETVERAEKVALNNYIGLNAFAREEDEVDEMMKEHGFKSI